MLPCFINKLQFRIRIEMLSNLSSLRNHNWLKSRLMQGELLNRLQVLGEMLDVMRSIGTPFTFSHLGAILQSYGARRTILKNRWCSIWIRWAFVASQEAEALKRPVEEREDPGADSIGSAGKRDALLIFNCKRKEWGIVRANEPEMG
jgi:hypothetical protein